MAYRTPNYTHEQKLYFLQRIQGVVDKVQDFRKDMNTTVQRNAAWNELLQAFNAAFPDRPPSTMAMLKTLWKRMKVESRNALIRRQEQLAAGVPVTALTEIQREVSSMVPNLIVKMEATADVDVLANPHVKAETDLFPAGGCGMVAPVDSDALANAHVKAEADAFPPGGCDQDGITITTINGSPDRGHSNAKGPVPHPRPASSPVGRSRTEARMELSEKEHKQRMRVLQAEEQLVQEKRLAVRQKHKAARYKKRYYRCKLQKLGAHLSSSSDDD